MEYRISRHAGILFALKYLDNAQQSFSKQNDVRVYGFY